MELKDQLSWKEFLKESQKEKEISSVKPFNRLIAHTKNLFIVAGYGSFTEGYVLVITKDFIPSYGLIRNDVEEELNFLLKLTKFHINKKYKRNSVVFEHGMCACIGGLDRAHVHIMSINPKSSSASLKKSIEKVLYKRKVGIEYIQFGKYKLENIHDINQFMDDTKNIENSEYEVVGNLLKLNDIKNLETSKWPSITLDHINKGGHYVYFESDFNQASFLTTQNFQTQFGRQVVYENELLLSNKFKRETDNIMIKNPLIEPWKWQNWVYEERIIETVNNTRKDLKKYSSEFSEDFQKFHFEII